MARPKEYDKEQVLLAATELFWKKGYHGTSLSELVAATKLNKQSMYQEFGNKSGLFQACLNYYQKLMGKKVRGILTKEPLSKENIKELFKTQLEYVNSKDFKGCLYVNSANEKIHLDSAACDYIDLFFKRLEELFFACLIVSFSKTEARIRATYCINLFAGIMTIGKTDQARQNNSKFLKFALSFLDEAK